MYEHPPATTRLTPTYCAFWPSGINVFYMEIKSQTPREQTLPLNDSHHLFTFKTEQSYEYILFELGGWSHFFQNECD